MTEERSHAHYVTYGCMGYLGYGDGRAGSQSTCIECDANLQCVERHKDNVKANFPDFTKLFDNYVIRYGESNAREITLKDFPTIPSGDPYTAAQVFNTQDGERESPPGVHYSEKS